MLASLTHIRHFFRCVLKVFHLPQRYVLLLIIHSFINNILQIPMEKVFQIKVPITRVTPQQTKLTRAWRRFQAATHGRLLVDVSAPLEEVVCNIFHSYADSLLWLLPDGEPFLTYTAYTPLLPADRHTKVLHLKRSAYDHGWKVLRRTPQGKAVSALWLLRLSPNEACLALYSSYPRAPR